MIRWIKDAFLDPEFSRRRKFLQRVSLFHGIPRREFGHLFQALVSRSYAPGDILFHEGEIGRALFILESGQVEISRRDPDGEMRRVAVLKSGDFCGEMSLLDELPRTATAVAMEPVRAYLLYKTELQRIAHSAPHIGVAILTHLASLLAARLRAIHDAAPYSIASSVKISEAPR
jgi:CRP/FNR family cyclic AMP-dependent transcriptional regulator